MDLKMLVILKGLKPKYPDKTEPYWSKDEDYQQA